MTESYNTAVARLVAALAKHDASSVSFILSSFVLGDLPATQLSSLALRELIDTAPEVLYADNAQETVERVLRNAASSSPPSIARPAREAKELLKERAPWSEDSSVQERLS